MRALFSIFGLLAALVAGPVRAGSVTIDVRGPDGRPLADAVVAIDSPRAPAGPIRFPWPYEMVQRNIMFQPRVLVVPVGANVAFPNRDRVRHHVYSFSPIRKFDLKLYGRDESRSMVFDKPGAVPIGCNIHDQMTAFIYVVDTPYAMAADAAGRVVIPNVAAGAATLRLWSPAIRGRGNTLSQPVTIPASGFATTITVR